MLEVFLSLALLLCLWVVGGQTFRVKAFLTGGYALLWGLTFIHPGMFTDGALFLWCAVVAAWTFGKYLGRR
jgi:hypothetical protein